MTMRKPGRHRRPGRLDAASTTLTRSAAVAATATGLIAGTAVTAGADPARQDHQAKGVEAVARLGLTVQQEHTVLVDRPAKAAPAPSKDASPVSFGTSGFTASAPVVQEVVAEPVAETVAVETSTAQGQAAAAVQARTQDTTASRDEVRTAPAQAAPAQSTAVQSAPRQEQTRQAAPQQPAPQQPAPQQPAPEPAPQQPAPQPAPSYGGSIVGIASGLMGIPYAWGSSNPSVGFDCSGFTKYVYAQVGISLPHSAAAQQAMATPVSNPQPGDLVFFGYPATHVAIYAGNGMVYQATSPGSVSNYMAIDSMWNVLSGYGRIG